MSHVIPRDGPAFSRLPSLTGLRFIAALAVFGFHLQAQGLVAKEHADHLIDLIFSQGATGVSFFFVLSGFVLTWAARPGDTVAAIWRRRMAKIVPNHVFTWLIAFFGMIYLSTHTVSLTSAAPSLFLVQAWIPVERVFFGVNTPAWSLSCEVAFYAAFPLLLRIIRKIQENRLWLLTGGLVSLIVLVPVLALPLPVNVAYWFVYVCPITRGLEFALGMVLARIVLSGRWIKVGLWTASAFLVVCYLASAYLPGAFKYVAGTVIAIALLIPAAAVADMTAQASPWRSRICVWLGEISFAFYLLHQLVIRFIYKLLGSPAMSAIHEVALGAFMLAVAVAAAWLLYRIVERPMMRLLAPQRRPGASQSSTAVAG